MNRKFNWGRVGLAAGLLCLPLATFAADKLDSGDTAWMITATALVLFMTIPGLSLFYAGMVRSKNVLSVMMQCFAITALMSIIWLLVGYAIAYGNEHGFWGLGNAKGFLAGLTMSAEAAKTAGVAITKYLMLDGVISDATGKYPKSVDVMFQMTFAIITPALIVGAFAERMKFSAMLLFMAIWSIIVYAPIAHWVWGDGGWLKGKGIIDFAGGTVVHINAGIAGLVACIMIGKRKGYPTTMMSPHNLGYTLMGASILWVGWFGFNAGSALAADYAAGNAMLVTQIATAAAALGWMFFEWMHHGKPSALGIASGAVAGLVAITPAAGAVGPMGAMVLGAIAGIGCFYGATVLKRKLGYDDSLDVFGVHAIGGIIGAVGLAIFASPKLGVFSGTGFASKIVDGKEVKIASIGEQLSVQLFSVAATIIYTAVMTVVILLVVKAILGLRVTEEQETEGLDITLHDERGYNL